MTENQQAFKEFLKARLKKREWTQADFLREVEAAAPDATLGKATISRWLDEADPTIPDLDNLMLISLVLKVGLETLLTYLYPGRFYAAKLRNLSADARLFAEKFDKLPEDMQKPIRILMHQSID